MPRKSAFIKISGDVYLLPECIVEIEKISKTYFAVVSVGGGRQINEMLRNMGIELKPHGPLGRELETLELRQRANLLLKKNQTELQDMLAEKNIVASVVIPFLDIATVECPLNGDLFLQAAYLGFDALFVITTVERLEQKKKQFAHLPKVKVIGLNVDD